MKALKYIAGIAAATVIALSVVTYISASEKDTNNSESKVMSPTDWFPVSVAGATNPDDRDEQLLTGPSSSTLGLGCDPEADESNPICGVKLELSSVPPQNTTTVNNMIDDIENEEETYSIQEFLDLGATISNEAFHEED